MTPEAGRDRLHGVVFRNFLSQRLLPDCIGLFCKIWCAAGRPDCMGCSLEIWAKPLPPTCRHLRKPSFPSRDIVGIFPRYRAERIGKVILFTRSCPALGGDPMRAVRSPTRPGAGCRTPPG